jgi:predicted  nucleic acid-binding Zn-ribbon protein
MSQKLATSLFVLMLVLIQGCGQELQKENEALKAQIKAAQEENTSLKQKLQSLDAEKKGLAANIEALEKQVADLKKAAEAAKKPAPASPAPKRK